MRYRTLAAILLGYSVRPDLAHAQGRLVAIAGEVRNESGATLNDVEVALDPQGRSLRKLTEEQGRFLFGNVRLGPHTLSFRRIGYFPQQVTFALADTGARLTIVLTRIPAPLDTIRVLGHQVGVIGVVAAREGLRFLDAAEVEVLHTSARTTTKNGGRFEMVDGVKSGPQVVFAKAPGFASRMVSVTVPESSTVEVALVLEPMSAPGAKRIAMPLAELEERVRWMGRGAAFVSGAELAEFRGENLGKALIKAMSLRKRGFLVGGGCTLVNGWQRGRGVDDFNVDEVEAIEYYEAGTDYTGTLALRGCSSSAAIVQLSSKPGSRPRRNVVGPPTIVVWLKR